MRGRRKVVITGAGLVSPLGNSLPEFWRRLEAGESGVAPLTRFDSRRFSCRLAAEVNPSSYVIPPGPYTQEIKRAGKFVHYAVVAAQHALCDGGITVEAEEPETSALFLGVSTGGLDEMESAVLRQEAKGPGKISPFQITSMLPNMATSLIALRYRFKGPQYTISGACASGCQALGQAFHGIRDGQFTWALAGGTDGVLTPISFSSFQAMHMLSPGENPTATPRPFDSTSNGIVLGEGAAVFVLEESSRAKGRGAHIYAELSGYGTCSGGERIALQSTCDLIRCIQCTLKDACLQSQDIDCVYAQAAGIKQGDESELEALQTLFGANETSPLITSIKGHIGHTFAASAPLNLAAAAGALTRKRVSRTLNLTSVCPKYAGLNLEPNGDLHNVRHCLINTYGFGGVNASLVVSRYNEDRSHAPVPRYLD